VTVGPLNAQSAVAFDFATAGPGGTALRAGVYLVHNQGAYPSNPTYATPGNAPISVSVLVHWDGQRAFNVRPGIFTNPADQYGLTDGTGYSDGTVNGWGLGTGFNGPAGTPVPGFPVSSLIVSQTTSTGNASTSKLLVWPLLTQAY